MWHADVKGAKCTEPPLPIPDTAPLASTCRGINIAINSPVYTNAETIGDHFQMRKQIHLCAALIDNVLSWLTESSSRQYFTF